MEHKTSDQEILIVGDAHCRAWCKPAGATEWYLIGNEAPHCIVAAKDGPHTAIPPVS